MGSIFASLPVFVVDSSNVHGSFKRWSVEFNLALRMKSIELGYDNEEVTTGTGDSCVTWVVNIFNPPLFYAWNHNNYYI